MKEPLYTQQGIEREYIRAFWPEEPSHYHAQAAYEEEARAIMEEAGREHDAYLKAGRCVGCGACNAKEAGTLCRPSGDSCPGDELWLD